MKSVNSMGNSKNSGLLELSFNNILNEYFCFRIYICSSFINKNYFPILDNGSHNANKLFLSGWKIIARIIYLIIQF